MSLTERTPDGAAQAPGSDGVAALAHSGRAARTRVLFVSDHLGLPGGLTHGATTYFTSVLPSLATSDVELTVCFLRERHPVAKELEAAGVVPRFLGRGKWDPLALADLRRIIREQDVQVVHAAGLKGILLARWAAHLEGRKTVIHLHDLEPLPPLLGLLLRLTAEWTDRALVVSRSAGELARSDFRIPPERVRVLHNGLPIGRFSEAAAAREAVRAALGYEACSRVIGVVGRLVPQKGHAVLLEAMPRVVERHPHASLLVVGDGPLRPELEACARRLGLDGSVRITGFRRDVPELLAAMDIVAMPSLREGLGFSALEAMAAGKPLVTSDAGGLPEVVEDGCNGIVVPAGDASALAGALVRLLDSPGIAARMAAEGRARVERFSIERHVEALLEEYRNVGAAPPSRAPDFQRPRL